LILILEIQLLRYGISRQGKGIFDGEDYINSAGSREASRGFLTFYVGMELNYIRSPSTSSGQAPHFCISRYEKPCCGLAE